jgi:hypothetical protein
MLYPAEAERNAASIAAVPLSVLPAGAARDALLAIARRGHDAYAYRAAGPEGPWNLWLGDLAEARPHNSRNGRVTVAEWCDHWRELVTEAHLSVEVRA